MAQTLAYSQQRTSQALLLHLCFGIHQKYQRSDPKQDLFKWRILFSISSKVRGRPWLLATFCHFEEFQTLRNVHGALSIKLDQKTGLNPKMHQVGQRSWDGSDGSVEAALIPLSDWIRTAPARCRGLMDAGVSKHDWRNRRFPCPQKDISNKIIARLITFQSHWK